MNSSKKQKGKPQQHLKLHSEKKDLNSPPTITSNGNNNNNNNNNDDANFNEQKRKAEQLEKLREQRQDELNRFHRHQLQFDELDSIRNNILSYENNKIEQIQNLNHKESRLDFNFNAGTNHSFSKDWESQKQEDQSIHHSTGTTHIDVKVLNSYLSTFETYHYDHPHYTYHYYRTTIPIFDKICQFCDDAYQFIQAIRVQQLHQQASNLSPHCRTSNTDTKTSITCNSFRNDNDNTSNHSVEKCDRCDDEYQQFETKFFHAATSKLTTCVKQHVKTITDQLSHTQTHDEYKDLLNKLNTTNLFPKESKGLHSSIALSLFQSEHSNDHHNIQSTTDRKCRPSNNTTNIIISSPNISLSLVEGKLQDSIILTANLPFLYPHGKRHWNDRVFVGGLYMMDIIDIKEHMSKNTGCWTVRNTNTLANSSKGLLLSEHSSKSSNEEDFILACEIDIPPYITSLTSLNILRLNSNDDEWTDDKISQVEIHVAARKISFHLNSCKTALIALTQVQNLFLPLQGWNLNASTSSCSSPTDMEQDMVEVRLQTKQQQEVVIQVSGSKCYLKEPALAEMKHILGRGLSPSQLLLNMSYCGMDLIPNHSSILSCPSEKMKEIEYYFIRDVSLLSTAFMIQSSSLNTKCRRNQGIYEIKESPTLYGGNDLMMDRYLVLMETDKDVKRYDDDDQMQETKNDALLSQQALTQVRCSIVYQENIAIGNTDLHIEDGSIATDCTFTPLDRTESSIHAMFCLEPITSAEVLTRVRQSNPLLTNTVRQLLTLLQPLSFTVDG